MRVREQQISAGSASRWRVLWHSLPRRSRPAAAPLIETLFIVAGLLALLLLVPHEINGPDGALRYQSLSDLLAHGRRDVMPYSIVGPLFAAPLWLLDRLTNHGEPALITQYNWTLLALGAAALYLLLRRRVSGDLLRRFLLLLVYGSLFTNSVRWFNGETFTALAVGVGIVVWVMYERRGAIAGFVAALLGVVNTPATLLAFALVALSRTVATHRIRFVLLPVAALLLILCESWVFRGSPFVNPYDGNAGFHTVMPYSGLPGFSYPALFGVLAILFSFGKGLIFFTPGLFLPIRARLRDIMGATYAKLFTIHLLWVIFVAGLIIVYCRWWAWYGGWTWGPRFFLLASMPASLAIAVRLVHTVRVGDSLGGNVVTLVVLSLSMWVGIDGAVFDNATLAPDCVANNYAQEFVCHFVPEFSPLWRPFVVAETISPASWAYIALTVAVFVYLASPLIVRIGLQCGEVVQRLRAAGVFDLGLYRF